MTTAQTSSSNWQSDALASVVVFLVALPLCMGIAIASGAPPAAGILTGIIGGIVVGMIQGSPMQVSGPAAGLTVIVWDIVQHQGLSTLGLMVIGAGAIQIVAGMLGGGRWFRAVPPSVIHGMLAGIGVLIFSSQFHVMVDDKPKANGLQNIATIPIAIWKGITPNQGLPHEEAALIGVLTIAVLLVWTRFAPKRLKFMPGSLVGVVVATCVANFLKLPIAHVNVPDSLIASIHLPTREVFSGFLNPTVWGSALLLAVVASAETLLCAAAVDRIHSGPRTNYNRELIAQGIGNALCGVFGALPMTGVIVRSSANVQAGAKTRLSAILHGAWILLLVVAFPQLLRLIPVSSLAAILVFTGYKLINPGIVRQLRQYGQSEVAIYAATVVAIVSTDLLKGVIVGLVLAIGKLLYRLSHLRIHVEDHAAEETAVIHLQGSATFLGLPDIAEALEAIPLGREVHIRFDELDHLDHATLELLSTWAEQHRAKGNKVIIDWTELERRYYTVGRGTPRATGEAASLPKEVQSETSS